MCQGEVTFILALWCVLATIRVLPAENCSEVRYGANRIGRLLDGYNIYTFESSGLAMCLYECAVVTQCLSLNYNIVNRSCELNSANSTTTSSSNFIQDGAYIYTDIMEWTMMAAGSCVHKPCHPSEICLPGQGPRCVKKVCLGDPPQVPGAIANPTGMYKMGDTLAYNCTQPDTFMEGDPEIICGRQARWTTPLMECKRPYSCASLKICNPNYQTDGEFWLFPSSLAGQKVKVYCSGMTSLSPKEYITVNSGTNSGHYAGRDHGSGKFTAKFYKIAVDIRTMAVHRGDTTFTDIPGLAYGDGSDCNCQPNCGPTGYFRIDTSGTGLIVDPSLQWYAHGYIAQMVDFYRSPGGQQISATCGGYCGGCSPTSTMYLELNPADVVPENAATMPSCLQQ